MTIERFYLACLSHASYLIVSEGEAAVIDPQRDVEEYVDYLDHNGLRLRYVIETHLHADFVSGHLELARRTGAEIVMGARAGAAFPHRAVVDGDELSLGTARLRIIETPGHTPEGITVAVSDTVAPKEPVALFTGDTLFAGDVGRPDLLGAVGITKEELGGMLYDSLHEKIMPFPDETRVYPAHGAGSSCGKSLRSVEFSTIGAEKLTNYALQPMSREEFIRTITEGQPEAPVYFVKDAGINRRGAPDLAGIVAAVRALTVEEMIREVGQGAILLDTRDPEDFSRGFVPGAINIGLDGQFAGWVGTLLPLDAPLVIVAEPGHEEESVTRCARIGHDNVIGYLAGGFDAWAETGREIDSFGRMDPDELNERLQGETPPTVIDVRRDGERRTSRIPGTMFLTLSGLDGHVRDIPDGAGPVIVQCAGGYRSSIAASILKKHGIADVIDLRGGIAAWQKAGLPVETEESNMSLA
jgi:glyoxylase-like metal-dependent hydrolase (beta-lactamase superfamily II)/rhodanese-related sulfurtransferase